MLCQSADPLLSDLTFCPRSFITVFVTVFAVVIALTKDLADVEGDRKYNIKTFATRIGVRGIAFLGMSFIAWPFPDSFPAHAMV